jgi:hypothetical protein
MTVLNVLMLIRRAVTCWNCFGVQTSIQASLLALPLKWLHNRNGLWSFPESQSYFVFVHSGRSSELQCLTCCGDHPRVSPRSVSLVTDCISRCFFRQLLGLLIQIFRYCFLLWESGCLCGFCYHWGFSRGQVLSSSSDSLRISPDATIQISYRSSKCLCSCADLWGLWTSSALEVSTSAS